jgi:hypothetical protein
MVDTMQLLILAGVGYVVLFRPDIISGLLENISSAVPEATAPAPVAAPIAAGEPNPATPPAAETPAAEDEKPAAADEDEKPAAEEKKTTTKKKSSLAYAWYDQNRVNYIRYPNYFEATRKITVA